MLLVLSRSACPDKLPLEWQLANDIFVVVDVASYRALVVSLLAVNAH